MSDETRAKELFLDALEQADGERAGFVRAACAGDDGLSARVERLLAAHASAERRLAQPREGALAPGAVFGPYRLVEPIGEGGFGVVWRARQETPVRREVALKVLRSGAERGDGLARFELERQALAALTHPNVARVYEGGSERGRPWFAMEWIDGLEITAHVERARASVRERLRLFLDVCRAIQHAHQRGIIHRDIKPSNVLVCSVDGVSQVKVIDFGIAQVGAELRGDWTRRTLTGQVLGTPSYMSPEQLLDTRDVDTRSDVYSLGMLLYELLVGAAPFEPSWLRERGPSEALRILREQDPPRPSTRATALAGPSAGRARELRGELDWIVMRCLEKDRERRYATVADLIADLERHALGQPVLAGPPSRIYRARKFARRHAFALGALTVTLLALLAGTTLATLEARRARRAERAELAAGTQARLEAERFQSIAEFLEHLLLSIDPAFAQGRDVTLLREILDRAASGIADRGDRPPEVEASLRRVIGGAYASLAEHDLALAQLERALELRRAALGADAPDTIELEGELAGVRMAAGELARAESLLGDALARARTVLGPDDARTLSLLSNFATLQRALGRPAQALELLSELEERRIRTLGREHDDTLLVSNNLALALEDAGRGEEAAERLGAILEVQLARHGERHPRTLAAMGNHASTLAGIGRTQEAEELLRRVLALKLELLEPAHPSVIVSRNNLANLLLGAGRQAEALEQIEAALAVVRADTDPHARLLVNQADGLRALGRTQEALASARRACAAAYASVGRDTPLARACEARLADTLLEAGASAEAEPLARGLLAALEADPEAGAGRRADARLRLGLVLAALGRTDEARAELERGLDEPESEPEWRRRAEAALASLDG